MSMLPLYKQEFQLDALRPGYPKFTALLALHPAFQNFRRFSRVRLRLLLLKQDEITELEASLDRIDSQETRNLFLGCSRRDSNLERQGVLSRMQESLAEYDSMLKDYQNVLHLPDSNYRDVRSVQNWINGSGCVARDETEFLYKGNDLANLAKPSDGALNCINVLVEEIALRIGPFIRKRMKFLPEAMKPGRSDVTKDVNIFLMGPRLRLFGQATTTAIIVAILLTPVVALFCIKNSLGRLIAIILSATLFLSMVSLWTRARTIEVFMAGASYAAVLVVFTSASNTFIS